MLLSQPENMPTAQLDGLRTLFAEDPAIEAAYFAQATTPGHHELTTYVIGVVGPVETRFWFELMRKTAKVIEAADPLRSVEMQSIAPNCPDDAWLKALKIYDPFYVRKSA